MNEHVVGKVHPGQKAGIPCQRTHTVNDLTEDEIVHKAPCPVIVFALAMPEKGIQAHHPQHVIVVVRNYTERRRAMIILSACPPGDPYLKKVSGIYPGFNDIAKIDGTVHRAELYQLQCEDGPSVDIFLTQDSLF